MRALGFLLLSLTFPMETSTFVYKALFGLRLRVCRDCFDSLSDRRIYIRCEGAGKTVVSSVCQLVQPELVFWDLSCSELQEIQKKAFLTLFLWPLYTPTKRSYAQPLVEHEKQFECRAVEILRS